MNVINYPLDDTHWFAEIFPKKYIVWHGTEGRTAFSDGKATSSIDHWASQGTIATAWLIDRDGSIYKTFDDEFWANHVGKGFQSIDQQSIGIELANELGLYPQSNGKMKTTFNAYYHGPFFKYEWNDRADAKTNPKFWASLSDEQTSALIELTLNICSRFNIQPKLYYPSTEFNPECLNSATIICHSNIRSDKTDIILQDDVIQKAEAAGITILR